MSAGWGRPRGLTWDICGRKLISLRLMEWLRRLLSSWHSSTPSRSVCARSKTWAVSQVTRWLGGSTLQLISHCPHCFHGSIAATLRPRRPPLCPPPPPPRPARPASRSPAPARPVRRGPTAPSRELRCVRARFRAGSGCVQPPGARRVEQPRGAGGGRCRSAAPAALLYQALPRAALCPFLFCTYLTSYLKQNSATSTRVTPSKKYSEN